MNNFDIEKFDETDYIKFVCKNTMSKNWNILCASTFVGIYKYFGFDGTVVYKEKGLFGFKISKTKST